MAAVVALAWSPQLLLAAAAVASACVYNVAAETNTRAGSAREKRSPLSK